MVMYQMKDSWSREVVVLEILDTTLDEGSVTPMGTFSFFSRETHTIYQPKLEAVWDDSVWSTGSLELFNKCRIRRFKIVSKKSKRII